MKKIYSKLLLSIFFAFWGSAAFAQECLPTGGCAFGGTKFPATTLTSTSSVFTPIATNMWAGEFAECNVTAGVTYHWSLCTTDGGSAPYDAQLTLYHGTTNAILCFSDDNCGLAPKIGWTATFTGTVKVRVTEYNCISHTLPNSPLTTMVWRVAPTGQDAGVTEIYTLGTISTAHNNPHVVSAVINNGGTVAMSNIPVTLNVTGANSYTNTVTIPTLAVGARIVVTFPGFSNTTPGNNTITVTVPADSYTGNSSKAVDQVVTPGNQSYAYGTLASGGVGLNSGTGEIASKFQASAGATLEQVKPNFQTAGKVFRVRIFNANGTAGAPGTLLYTSANQTSVLGVNTVNISPALALSGPFYISIQQVTASDNMSLGYQSEIPLRLQTFYVNTNVAAPVWGDLAPGNQFRPMVEAVFSSGPDAAVSQVYTLGTISTVHSNPHVVSAVVTNTGTSAMTNLPVTLNVTGANTFTYSLAITSLASGASTVVTFPGYTATNTGNNTVTVSVPTDSNPANNSKAVTQVVTPGAQSYAYGTTISSGAGFNTGTGEVAAKFSAASGATLQQVKPTFDAAGKVYRVRVFNANGTAGAPGALLYTSPNQTSVAGLNTVTISPALSVPTSFFVSIEQVTASNNMELAYQDEEPLRAGAFYANVDMTTPDWDDLSPSVPFRIMVEAVLSACQLAAQPAAITGPASLCGTGSVTYSVPAVTGATSYTWTLPTGWTMTSGQGSNSITVTPTATGGTVLVAANNACGTGAAQTLTVAVNPAAPAQPGTITGSATACSGVATTYSVAAVAGATSYTWTLPSGWSGTSTTNSISATAGATGGTISVIATNGCGSSTARTLAVTTGTVPSTPGTITGSSTICQNATGVYSVAAVTGATSYTWTLPNGWTGTSTSNSINVTAGATGGTISVSATNACGSSSAVNLPVTVNAAPAQPGTISGPANLCQGTSGTYTVAAVTGATSYTWTLPTGWTGTSTTNSISATAGSAGGNITVTATNSCGTSVAQTLAVTSTAGLPAQPATITGSASVCTGANVTYSVAAVTGATSYTWTLPTGWTGTSTSNSINAVIGTTSGTVSVIANNGCGTSPAQTLAVTVAAIDQPGAITGTAAACEGATTTLTVPAVTGATAYTWTLPTGWTGTSTTNSITVTAGATGGTLSVTATNGTCTSVAQTVNLTVNAQPAMPTVTAAAGVLASSATSGNQWLLNGTPISGATGQFLTPTQSGFYTVTVTNSSGCETTSAPFTYTMVGISDAFAEGIQLHVYPNPTRNYLTIEANINQDMQVEVTSLIGQVVMKTVAPAVNGKVNYKLNTTSLSQGVYLLNLTSKNGKTTSKLIIQ